MKYQQKSFSVGYMPGPADEPPCPMCPREQGIGKQMDNHVRLWKLCPQHRSELPGEAVPKKAEPPMVDFNAFKEQARRAEQMFGGWTDIALGGKDVFTAIMGDPAFNANNYTPIPARDWAVEKLLHGEEVQMFVRSRGSSSGALASVMRVRIAPTLLYRDAYVLSYVYNGEYAELEVDGLDLRKATSTEILLWADAAFMG